jgi:hypothetical protein
MMLSKHQRHVLTAISGIVILSGILYLGIYKRVIGQSGMLPITTTSETGLTGISETLEVTAADKEPAAQGTERWTVSELAPGLHLKESNGTQVVLTEHVITTQQELATYRDRMIDVLRNLDANTTYKAIVTFACVQSEETLREVLRPVKLIDLKYRSYPSGVGTLPADMSPETRAHFAQFEAQLATHMAKTNDIHEFRLVDGFVAAQIEGRGSQLVDVSKMASVYLVDVGALGWQSTYPKAIIALPDDLYYEANELIGLEPCSENSTHPKVYLPLIRR